VLGAIEVEVCANDADYECCQRITKEHDKCFDVLSKQESEKERNCLQCIKRSRIKSTDALYTQGQASASCACAQA
jgi:hypothetical protein